MRLGFTLIELFIVITIVAVLATLMMPAVQMVRRAATTAVCASNVRQVGLGFVAYATDWDGQYPADSRLSSATTAAASDAWYDRIPDFLGDEAAPRVMRCAGHRAVATVPGFTNAAPKSFKMNDQLDAAGRPRYLAPCRISDAAEVLLLVDAVSGVTGMGQWSRALPSGVTDARHRGRINVLACDGATLLRRQAPANWTTELTWASRDWQ